MGKFTTENQKIRGGFSIGRSTINGGCLLGKSSKWRTFQPCLMTPEGISLMFNQCSREASFLIDLKICKEKHLGSKVVDSVE